MLDICISCGCSVYSEGIRMLDGRCICKKCAPAVVKTQDHIEWVKERVVPVLRKYGAFGIPDDVPISIVSTNELAKIQNCKDINLTQLGLTYTSCMISLFGTKMEHKIYIVEGLHKILFAGVLAHEYLHVWQNERNIKLPLLYCEGFCNLGSYLVYRNISNELSHTLYVRMRDGNDPVYSEGFRQVKSVFDAQGGGDLMKTMNVLINKI